MGIDKLIDVLIVIWEALLPFEIIRHYDRGVRLRFGKAILQKEKGKSREEWKVKILEPGFHWKWPLMIDEISTHMVKITTMDLPEQTVTTKDDKSVVVRGVLKYDVWDVATLLLETDGPAAAVADISTGIIKESFAERTWEECKDPKFSNKMAIDIRREAKKWGINVHMLTLPDLGQIRSIRLITKQ